MRHARHAQFQLLVRILVGLEVLGALDRIGGGLGHHVALAQQRAPRRFAGLARLYRIAARIGVVGIEGFLHQVVLFAGEATAQADRDQHERGKGEDVGRSGHGHGPEGRNRPRIAASVSRRP